MHTTEEVVRAGRGGERGGLRALAKRRPRRAAHRVVDLVVFCSTMPNGVCMLLGNFTPVYIPIAVVRTGHASLPAPNQPART